MTPALISIFSHLKGKNQAMQKGGENNPADGFAQHMQGKSAAQSEFSRSKTMKEQREFLPIYSVKYDLMNVIRENNVVVIVGETGSGKTTQLSQYFHEEGTSPSDHFVFVRHVLQPENASASHTFPNSSPDSGF